MNNTTTAEMLPSPGLKIITDLDNEEIDEEITLEGPRNSTMGLEGSWDHLEKGDKKHGPLRCLLPSVGQF